VSGDSAFRPDQIVFHETFGPGRVAHVSPRAIEVEFHAGRRETLRPGYAQEKLRLCAADGFAGRFLSGKASVLQALETDPREVVAWLSADLGRELTGRTAKPLLKRLRLFPDDVLDATWDRGSRKAQAKPPKRRMSEDAIKVVNEAQAKELESELWNLELHIDSRNATMKALAEFYEARADEDFFLRVLFVPVPAARARAFGFFKKRAALGKVWEYLVRKNVDEKSAPGMLDVWFRVTADSTPDEVRTYGERAAEIFIALLGTRAEGASRGETLRKLLGAQTGSGFSIAKTVAWRMPREWWDELLPELTADAKRAAFQLYFQSAVYRSDETEAIDGLIQFLSHFEAATLPDLVVAISVFAKTAGRFSFLRRFLKRSAELFASEPALYPNGLERLRGWLIDNRDPLDPDLAAFFARLGHPVEDRPVRLDRAGHLQRLQDVSVPFATRESSLKEIATELQRGEVVELARKLAAERGVAGERLLHALWGRWQPGRDARETAELLLDLLGGEDGGETVRNWAFEKVEESGVGEEIASVLAHRIQARRLGEGLDGAVRALLGHLQNRALGARLRMMLFTALAEREEPGRKEFAQTLGDALAPLGVQTDVFDFIRDIVESKSNRIAELSDTVAELERKVHDVLASDEVAREIRRLVDESLRAREAQLRDEWERGLEVARLGLAELYVDLATFAAGLRSKIDDDTATVGEILNRRLEQLLSARLGLAIIGRPGEVVTFDSAVHEPAGDGPAIGERVLVVRPGIQKSGSREVVAKAVVKPQ
jgi:hypothetical protein